MAPTCLYAWLTTNETTDGVLGYFLSDLEQDITELLDSLKCNLAASDGSKHNVPEVFYGLNSLIIQELPAHSCHMRPGIVVHQEQPRTHCTSVGSDNGSKDFILIPNDSHGAIV